MNIGQELSGKRLTWLFGILSVPVALFIGRSVAQGNVRMVAMFVAAILLFFFVFGLSNMLWLFAVGSVFIPGQITILPLPFKLMEIILMLVVARYIVENVIFKKQWFRLGPAPDKYFLFGILIILLIHGYSDRFAMRVFGSDVWGGRQYVSILIGYLAYSVVQSSPLDYKLFRMLPTLVVFFGSFDFFMMMVSQLVPGLSQAIWNIYTGVSLADTGQAMASRWGFMGNFGYLLLFWSLADCRIPEFLTKRRLGKAAIFFLAILMCLASGYRSTVALATVIVVVAGVRDFGFRGLFGVLPLAGLMAVLVIIQSAGFSLPKQIQRGLAFLPGDWDTDVVYDAGGSLDFRQEVWDLWLETQFPKHPILGRGFGLKMDEMMATLPYLQEGAEAFSLSSAFARNDAFVISGNIHNGFYSIIDRFGLIGLICFLGWTLSVLCRLIKYLHESRNRPLIPATQWLCLYMIPFTIGFFPGALKVEQFMVQQLFFMGLFLALSRIEASTAIKRASTSLNSGDGSKSELGILGEAAAITRQ